MSSIVLASTSPYRAALLSRLGIDFETRAPSCDETVYQNRIENPLVLAETLAQAKADSVRQILPKALIIGCDQLAHCVGRILGKPGSREAAIDQLTFLAGRTHDLITAVVVLQGDTVHRHTDITRLTMRSLDRAALARYVERDDPVDCAGAYKLECAGIALFDRIVTADHTAISGLPLMALTGILRSLGVAVP